MLLNFLHTLNLLIGMCENALNTKEDIDTPAESGAATTGQLISECLFDNLKFSKKPTKNLTDKFLA